MYIYLYLYICISLKNNLSFTLKALWINLKISNWFNVFDSECLNTQQKMKSYFILIRNVESDTHLLHSRNGFLDICQITVDNMK